MNKGSRFLLVAFLLLAGCAGPGPELPDDRLRGALPQGRETAPEIARAVRGKPLDRPARPKAIAPTQGGIAWSEFGQPVADALDKIEVVGRRPREYGLMGNGAGFKLLEGPYVIPGQRNESATLWTDTGYIGWVIVKVGDVVLKDIDFPQRFGVLRWAENPIPITVRSMFGKEEQLYAYFFVKPPWATR